MRQNLKLTLNRLHSTAAHLWRGCVLLSFLLCVCATAAAQTTTENIELLSVNGAGDHAGNAFSSAPQASADSRFVVFQSTASDLAANDTNGATSDIFVRDVQQHTTALVSVNAAGTASGNGASSGASITPDGRFVLFESDASDLVPDDANAHRDLFVRDLQQNKTTLVSVNAAGTGSGGGDSFDGLITPDGRYVVFASRADDLVAGDSNQPTPDVFRRDLQMNTTALVSVNTAGTNGGNNVSSPVAVTPNGRYVIFVSNATDLVNVSVNGSFTDIYRRDLQTNTTALVSVNRNGSGGGNGASFDPSISDDGQVVAFNSRATDVGAADNNETRTSVYARDFTNNTTALISQKKINMVGVPSASLPRLSADGRYVVYKAGYLDDDPLFNSNDADHDKIMRRDRLTNTLTQLPLVRTGVCNGFNCRSRISEVSITPDGRYVAYTKFEYRRLAPGEPPRTNAIVLLDASNGNFEFMPNFSDTAFGQPFTLPALSIGNLPTSLKLPFSSSVKLSDKDTNTTEDVYLFFAPHARFAFTFFGVPFVEESGAAVVTVSRNGLFTDGAASVHYTTSDGTATAGSDYTPVSGTLNFAPGETVKTFSVPLLDDNLLENEESIIVTLSDPSPGDKIETPTRVVGIAASDLYRFQFSATRYDASEASGHATLTVELVGDPTPTQTLGVSYTTTDGTASNRSDYNATAGRLVFAPGERSKSFDVLVNDDAFVEGDETINLYLSSEGFPTRLGTPFETQIFIASEDTTPPVLNPIDQSQYFVAQHYRDFLNRQPDAEGLQFWTAELDKLTAGCAIEPDAGTRARCVLFARAQISTAFFLSIEFQQTSYEVIRLYQTSFDRSPDMHEFIIDTQEISRGVVVGRPGWQAILEANKQRFADAWMNRSEFVNFLGTFSNADYVGRLFFNGTGDSDAEPELKAALIAGLNASTETRATVLRKIADSRSVYNRQYNPAFVLMQYYGYLRRAPNNSPDIGFTGYNFWLAKLNQFSLAGEDVSDPVTALTRIRRAQMVEAFLDSDEYRRRFGP